MNMVEATVAIGTTLIGIVPVVLREKSAPQTAVDGKQRHFGDYDRYQYGSSTTIDASAV
jgi:hypothetical protein